MFSFTQRKSVNYQTTASAIVIPIILRKKGKQASSPSMSNVWSPDSAKSLRVFQDIAGPEFNNSLKYANLIKSESGTFETFISKSKQLIYLIRISEKDNLTELATWQKVAAKVASYARSRGISKLAIITDLVPQDEYQTIATSLIHNIAIADYQFTTFKSKPTKNASNLKTLELIDKTRNLKLRDQALIKVIVEGVFLARDLVNTPPSDMNPKHFTSRARIIAKNSPVRLRVINKTQLAKLKAGGILGVGKGSKVEPALLHLSYTPRSRNTSRKSVLLIGKGVTFDSGGLSIKPASGMMSMKNDMAGAATVLAVMKIIAKHARQLNLKIEVNALIPLVENMVSGDCIKPGDVVRMINGKTVEVLNTDAEGRLILADALSYANKIKPDIIIDLATLTGAVVAALGDKYAGLFSNTPQLANALLKASDTVGEKLWQLPLANEYRSQLESKVADLKNIGSGGPGAIIAALFLQEFVPAGVDWAHLDVAGPVTAGETATGYGVKTLIEYLQTM